MNPVTNSDGMEEAVDELRNLDFEDGHVVRKSTDFFALLDKADDAPEKSSPPRRVGWWILFPMVAAAAAASLLTWNLANPRTLSSARPSTTHGEQALPTMPPDESKTHLVEAGSRVAMIPMSDSRYQFQVVGPHETVVHVRRGMVTLRRFHDALAPHSLTVTSDGYSFVAKGTIFTVESAHGEPKLFVHEGAVSVVNPEGEEIALRATGEVWPAGYQATSDARIAASLLKGHAIENLSTAQALPDEKDVASVVREKVKADPRPHSPSPASPLQQPSGIGALPPAQVWQQARLLRSQNKNAESLATLKSLVASNDPTWAPLAIIEQIRIFREAPHGLPLSEADVLSLASEFRRRFPKHGLQDELSSMVCPIARKRSSPNASSFCRDKP